MDQLASAVGDRQASLDAPSQVQNEVNAVAEREPQHEPVDEFLDALSREDFESLGRPCPASPPREKSWLQLYTEKAANDRRAANQRLSDEKLGRYLAEKNATNSSTWKAAQAHREPGFPNDRTESCPVVALGASRSPICPLQINAQPTITPTSSSPVHRVQRAANENLKPWSKTTDKEKLAIATSAAEHHLGVAFSLNLSIGRERALLKAAANSNDPVRLFSGYLNRELKKDLGDVPAYGFLFEFPRDGRLHVHGVLVSKEGSTQDPIKKAMMRAGGRISGRAASRQVKLEAIYDGIGWHGYIMKDFRSTIDRLGTDKIIFISHALGRLAREFHWRS